MRQILRELNLKRSTPRIQLLRSRHTQRKQGRLVSQPPFHNFNHNEARHTRARTRRRVGATQLVHTAARGTFIP